MTDEQRVKAEAQDAEIGSAILRKAMDSAFRKHANTWDIRADQARALLLDRKVVA